MAPPTSPTPRRRKRPRPLPHVNARNLAIEKRRREEMNGNFLDLAHLVPSLAHTQRLTKVRIVGETIAHLREQRALCAVAAHDMRQLLAENRRLAAELSLLRSGGQVVSPPPPAPETMARLLAVGHLGDGGSGTATLRDAHEGPEPRKKTAAEDESQQQGTGLSLTMNGNDTSQYDQSSWDTGFAFTSILEPQQQQFLLPSSALNMPAESSSLLAPIGVPTPPREGFDFDTITSLAFPTFLIPEDSLLNTTTLSGADSSDVWSGLGL